VYSILFQRKSGSKKANGIAQILNASPKTIEAHRNRLRKKLGLTNQRIQLRDYLLALV
jgi:DNA-binding CsgD family transcriptional regulator